MVAASLTQLVQRSGSKRTPDMYRRDLETFRRDLETMPTSVQVPAGVTTSAVHAFAYAPGPRSAARATNGERPPGGERRQRIWKDEKAGDEQSEHKAESHPGGTQRRGWRDRCWCRSRDRPEPPRLAFRHDVDGGYEEDYQDHRLNPVIA